MTREAELIGKLRLIAKDCHWQLLEDAADTIDELMRDAARYRCLIDKASDETYDGTHSVGDYIIKGIKGEFYPCKPDIFKMTYEEADLKDVVNSHDAEKLYGIVKKFIEQNHVSCPEVCCEDRVYENAPNLVEELADIVGYYVYPEEE